MHCHSIGNAVQRQHQAADRIGRVATVEEQLIQAGIGVHGDIHAKGDQQIVQLIDRQLVTSDAVAECQEYRVLDPLVALAAFKQRLPGVDLLDACLRRRISLICQIIGVAGKGIDGRHCRAKIGADQPGGGGKIFIMLFGDVRAMPVGLIQLHRLAVWGLLHGCMLATAIPFRKG